MSTFEFTKAYIDRLCREIGTRADAIYNEKTSAWYFARGTSTIEVFMTTTENDESNRIFIRCFAPLFTLNSSNPVTQFDILKKALELNTRHMGIKLSLIPEKSILCLIAERDIEGMDYQEFVSMISDIGYWADYLESHLQEHFGKL